VREVCGGELELVPDFTGRGGGRTSTRNYFRLEASRAREKKGAREEV
jgi:hypothetical protein